MRMTTPLLVIVLVLASCTSQRGDGLDPDRVLHMAGQEAAGIANPTERLTRQLNVAFRQIQNGNQTDARATLGAARRTLGGPHDAVAHDQPPLSDHDRLAGWVSLSELSREAEDRATANAALDRALDHLNRIEPAPARCDYVPGVAREVRMLRGDRASAELLVRAGQWATGIAELPTRRAAYLAFATELFRANDYEAARAMLRRDDDAAWRADALTALSDMARFGPVLARGGAVGVASSSMADGPAASEKQVTREQEAGRGFGKAVDFRSRFYRAQ